MTSIRASSHPLESLSAELQAQQQARAAYEALLAECCHDEGILALLKQHRPYFEALPSVRRPQESMVSIPLPNVRSRETVEVRGIETTQYRIRQLPCDVALMMCDPEWKIKTGIEIVLFIQRPQEEFSDLLSRWRQTQIELGQGVEWLMPRRYKHLLSEGTETPLPLFVVFLPSAGEIPAREACILRGLKGAGLPFATQFLNQSPGDFLAKPLAKPPLAKLEVEDTLEISLDQPAGSPDQPDANEPDGALE